MELKQLVSVIRILLFVLVLLGALFGALAGFRKGFYKTTTKTILKAILVIVAVFLAVPVANLISNIEISGLNTVWRNRNGGSGELNPPTLQNFVSAYLRNRTGLSPRNGISVYQRTWNLASSLIAIFVFFIERILIQILMISMTLKTTFKMILMKSQQYQTQSLQQNLTQFRSQVTTEKTYLENT